MWRSSTLCGSTHFTAPGETLCHGRRQPLTLYNMPFNMVMSSARCADILRLRTLSCCRNRILVDVSCHCWYNMRCATMQVAIIQSRLLDVGSAVATPTDKASVGKLALIAFPPEATAQLEAWIDDMDQSLPPLTNFILPSGCAVCLYCIALLHMRSQAAICDAACAA